MALNIKQQISELINNSSHILITTSAKDKGDGFASALALKLLFDKMSKPADIVIPATNFHKFDFLPASDKVKSQITSLKKLIINLDLSKTKVHEFNYEISGNTLKIFITPEKGEYAPGDVTLGSSDFKYDLIICISAPDLESLGSLYEQHSDFFYHTNIINIDSSADNEHFGQVNLIDLNQSSSAEIVYQLIKSISPTFANESISTCLLAGIIINTNHFSSYRVTPITLTHASELIKLGGDREKIISGLNRHKNLPTLNLWGRILARLKTDTHYHLAWSLLSQTDFQKSGANPENISGIIDELISNSPLVETTVILYETSAGNIAGQVYTSKNYDALKLTRELHGTGDKFQADFALATNRLVEAEEIVINKIRSRLKPDH